MHVFYPQVKLELLFLFYILLTFILYFLKIRILSHIL